MENLLYNLYETPNNTIMIPNNTSSIDINLNIINDIEKNTINSIFKSLYNYNKVLNYIIKDYKIDLYILDIKLAIECIDKNYIYQYNQKEKIIKSELNCEFYRYDSNATDFCIFKTIGEIFSIIKRLENKTQ